MTSFFSEIEYREIYAPQALEEPRAPSDMPSTSPSPGPGSAKPAASSGESCTHPRVQIVARGSDGEFVECLECREIFEASEFQDMEAEERQDGAA